jgi:hypothetical protein
LRYKTRCGSSKKSYRPSGQSGHFGNTTINSVNGADIANTVEVMYGVDCIYNFDAALRKKVIDQVVKVVILAIQQSTPLMVPILPTQLRSCMVSIAYNNSMRLFENKVIDQVVKVVILAIQQSTPLMVPILPTQLRSCMVSIAI